MYAKRLLVLSLILIAACKPPTPADQLDSILSWIGTAQMAGDAWLRHSTPDTYTRQTLKLSHESLRKISDDLLESPPPNTDISILDSALTGSRRRIARMAALVAAKNAPDFARELDSLRVNRQFLKNFSDSVGSKR
jgi:hypothetical protein